MLNRSIIFLSLIPFFWFWNTFANNDECKISFNSLVNENYHYSKEYLDSISAKTKKYLNNKSQFIIDLLKSYHNNSCNEKLAFNDIFSKTKKEIEQDEKEFCENERKVFEEKQAAEEKKYNEEQKKLLQQKQQENKRKLEQNKTNQTKQKTQTKNIIDEETYTITPFKKKEFVCSFKKPSGIEYTNGVFYINWKLLKNKSPYNYFMSQWGKWNTKIAFENQFIKQDKNLRKILSWKNIELQNKFLKDTCVHYDKKLIIKNPLAKNIDLSKYYIWLSEKDQRNILFCYLLRNKDQLTVKSWIHTEYSEVRETNIWIGISSIAWIWKNWETISVMNKTQSVKWYIDWLALFVDKEDKNKVIAKPVSQGWICWVSTVFYQALLNSYTAFDVKERYPHLSFYKQYYNKDWLDASLYWENGIVYKDLKVQNNTWWPVLVLTSINPNKEAKTFDYYVTIWSMYYLPKTDITYWKKYKKDDHTCIDNWVVWVDWKTIKTITSCYKWGMF